jgi:hypothetical protein
MEMLIEPSYAKELDPIFIIGAPRSGTSALTWALGQHPNIQPMPETGWIASMAVGAFLSHRKGSERGKFSHLSNVELPLEPFMRRTGEAIDRIVHDVYAERCGRTYGKPSLHDPDWSLSKEQQQHALQIRRHGSDPKQRWIDGTPLNSYYLWAISLLFPHARYIHNLRRPDEVATSLEGFDKVGAEPLALEDGLRTWIEHTENAWFAERALGAGNVFRVDFERISQDTEGMLRDICQFLGEDFSEDCRIPLAKKLNSSEVEQRREANLEILRDSDVFVNAEAIYDAVRNHPAGTSPDEEALDILRRRFLGYCHDRALV